MLKRGVPKACSYGRLFQNWEIAIAKKLINQFQKTNKCFKDEEFDDLLQECLIHWLFKKDNYDPSKNASQKTFMGKVIQNKLTDLAREKETDKRKINDIAVSLDEPIYDEADDSATLIDKCSFFNHEDEIVYQIELKTDISKILHRLTPNQIRICDLIGPKGLTIMEVSESLKTPRSTIYDELKRIRDVFSKAGLAEYLK